MTSEPASSAPSVPAAVSREAKTSFCLRTPTARHGPLRADHGLVSLGYETAVCWPNQRNRWVVGGQGGFRSMSTQSYTTT